jgi:PIN domain nuclease of toxin-antitoxin system
VKRVLLDTHAFLWFVFDDPRLSTKAARAIEADGTQLLLSIASLWEIAIKLQLGKLSLGMDIEEFFERFVHRADLQVLDVGIDHLRAYSRLPLHHRDPFDRLLVAQATVLGVPIVTSDEAFRRYTVTTLW